ncbi:hypothetical protein SUNI508_05554 [Seiridium unicorne]|uniref:Peroxisomal trans-2-enoyl-CoA reductase n=1 Tax=Seiridium unicorne TaxID=138068 RepID=A0ABR2V3Y3_9PEZI
MDTTEDFSPYRADGKLYGFVCVVTGAAQPVGQAIIHELAAHGAASIYACDRPSTTDSFSKLVDEIGKEFPNSKIIPYPYNVAREEETLVLIDEVLNNFGRLDVWVSSSGLLGPPSIAATTTDDLQKCFEAHSMAPFFALKYAPAAMAKLTEKGSYPNAAPKTQKYGSIIVISSVASVHGGCWGPCYTLASHAALGVVKAGVATLKGTGVRINCISPGQIDVGVDLQGIDMQGMTAQFPPASLQKPEIQKTTIGLERSGTTQEVARVAGFLASGFSSYVTGANMIVDGGASHFRVGATILAGDGTYVSGANVENAAYPVGTCAERVAFGKAVTEGHKKFRAVAVATDISPPASPCGMCRQFIREFCDLKTPILMFDKNDDYIVLKLEELLPLSFGPEALPPVHHVM